MSVPIQQKLLTKETKLFLYKNLQTFVPNPNKMGPKTIVVSWPLKKSGNGTFNLPLGIVCNTPELNNISPPFISPLTAFGREALSDSTCGPSFVLRPEQEIFLKKVLVSKPERPFSQAWDLNPGFGKTITCIAAILFYNIDTIIVVHRACLLKQWQVELALHTSHSKLAIKVVMLSQLSKCNVNGLLIIDEAHACMTKNGIEIFTNIEPKIMIGLSGSFFRYDANQPYLKWLYGEPITLPEDAQELVKESTTREITLRVVETNISPTVVVKNGRLDWNCVLTSLSENEERNLIISDLVNFYHDKKILILVKRVEHGKLLHNLISDSVTCFGSDSVTQAMLESRVLISSSMKIGTGMSLNRLNCIILATDVVNYTIQYVSRILREKTQDALIIDIVDKNFTLAKHFAARKVVYEKLNVKML